MDTMVFGYQREVLEFWVVVAGVGLGLLGSTAFWYWAHCACTRLERRLFAQPQQSKSQSSERNWSASWGEPTMREK